MPERKFQIKAERTRFCACHAPLRIADSLELSDEPTALDCRVGAFRTSSLVDLGPSGVVPTRDTRRRGTAGSLG